MTMFKLPSLQDANKSDTYRVAADTNTTEADKVNNSATHSTLKIRPHTLFTNSSRNHYLQQCTYIGPCVME